MKRLSHFMQHQALKGEAVDTFQVSQFPDQNHNKTVPLFVQSCKSLYFLTPKPMCDSDGQPSTGTDD